VAVAVAIVVFLSCLALSSGDVVVDPLVALVIGALGDTHTHTRARAPVLVLYSSGGVACAFSTLYTTQHLPCFALNSRPFCDAPPVAACVLI
jgi:hypothetical protein